MKRLKAIRIADNINSIEGAPVSCHTKLVSQRWVKGEISGEQMKAILIKTHKQLKVEELKRSGKL
ncbi:MAG: hypothetical protein SNH27_10790 [Rikenellaceae bacterium]